jgi:hypothetical protein
MDSECKAYMRQAKCARRARDECRTVQCKEASLKNVRAANDGIAANCLPIIYK